MIVFLTEECRIEVLSAPSGAMVCRALLDSVSPAGQTGWPNHSPLSSLSPQRLFTLLCLRHHETTDLGLSFYAKTKIRTTYYMPVPDFLTCRSINILDYFHCGHHWIITCWVPVKEILVNTGRFILLFLIATLRERPKVGH